MEIANALKASTDDMLVDSLVHPYSNQNTDAHYLLLDYSPQETAILIKTMRALRDALKNYSIK